MTVQVDFDRRFSPAEATRGQYVPIVSSTLTNYTTGDAQGIARGRYAQLNYIVGSEPGALNIALSGGTVILPVSAVNISEPLQVENTPGQDFVVTQNYVDTTTYSSVNVPSTGVATINFAPAITLLEIFNNDTVLPVFVGFNNVGLSTLSAQALPVVAETFYSIDRTVSTVYIGNADSSSSIDVRVIGHRKA